MEKITINPGLQHLTEKVFWDLDVDDLKICAQINLSCKQILQTPMFCLRKFEHFSKKNQKDWMSVIKSVKNSDKGIAIICYLRLNLREERLVDLPCYTNSDVQDDIRKKICISCEISKLSNEEIEMVKILAPLTERPNAPDRYGRTPIYYAAGNGHTEIVRTLSPLTEKPNAPNFNGYTPIHKAADCGHIEIVQILAPLTDNPNAPNKSGETPIYRAAWHGHTEIVKILAPLTANSNDSDVNGKPPIYWAAHKGIANIVKLLGPSTDNPITS